MNTNSPTLEKIEKFKRDCLKELLNQLGLGHHTKFRLMYAMNGGKRSIEEALKMDINDIIDQIPEEKINWAICQCENSIKKLQNEQP